jgi:hypothetical protein
MDWIEYKSLSEKTMSTEFHCDNQVENLIHGVTGILTELDELFGWNNEFNKMEEVADVFWYLALIDRELKLNLQMPNYTKGFTQITSESLVFQSFRISINLLDSLKKKLFYNKNINFDTFSVQTKSVFENMCTFCFINNIQIDSILDTNIEKLRVRFGDKFTTERAINRDLNLEKAILEKN